MVQSYDDLQESQAAATQELISYFAATPDEVDFAKLSNLIERGAIPNEDILLQVNSISNQDIRKSIFFLLLEYNSFPPLSMEQKLESFNQLILSVGGEPISLAAQASLSPLSEDSYADDEVSPPPSPGLSSSSGLSSSRGSPVVNGGYGIG